ncbi:hypothetical protein F5Y19DRAFT_188558 [Xylariaceae sp. FL1651]|nr:hypothetical protein F5Y19DRAFT_188558 [Xylariaceae sp. FL1651]
MILIPILTTLLGLVASAPVEPTTTASAGAACPTTAQMVHLVFHGGPASYDLTIPADGLPHPTNNGLNINLIDAPDFNIEWCTFTTHQPVALVWQTTPSPTMPSWLISQYAVGPPQPIDSVRCSGTCLSTYSTCYDNGMYIGSCCNGYCAADKCRPWPTNF